MASEKSSWFALQRWLAIGVASALATSLSAQPTPNEPADNALPFGAMPREIFGVPCSPSPGGPDLSASLMCFPADIRAKPMIGVTITPLEKQPTRAEIIAAMQASFHERRMFKVIREQDFTPPGDPEAIGFRGLYQTDLGNRYVWSVFSRGKLVRVIATVIAPTDFKAMIGDIEKQVFGVPN